MSIKRLQLARKNANARIFAFDSNNGVNEYLCMFTISNPELSFQEQLEELLTLCKDIQKNNFEKQLKNLNKAKICFKRYYLSDAANQFKILKETTGEEDCAVSTIQQPPLSGAKIGMWVYFMTGTNNHKIDNHLFCVSHNGYEELWSTQNTAPGIESYTQTEAIFADYMDRLEENGCTMAENCIRTWFYVNDIDNQYAGVVRARNVVFDAAGLTEKTHYVASTGIDGRDADPRVYCKMNAIAIKGIKKEQIHYLYALNHLNRTSEYGVRFERGTFVDFANRRRVYISGTASINNKGEIMYEGDIRKQVYRMWENIEALLKEAECTFDNVAEFSVYLRDSADYAVVDKMYKEKFPHTPYIILNAAVCRPGWLIESECIALKSI